MIITFKFIVDIVLYTFPDSKTEDNTMKTLDKDTTVEDSIVSPLSYKLYTDELADTNRKLDVGIGILKDIKSDTSALPEIKSGIENMNTKFDTFNSKFDFYIIEQKEHNQRMDEHNQRMDEHNKHLEKILEKLAER